MGDIETEFAHRTWAGAACLVGDAGIYLVSCFRSRLPSKAWIGLRDVEGSSDGGGCEILCGWSGGEDDESSASECAGSSVGGVTEVVEE